MGWGSLRDGALNGMVLLVGWGSLWDEGSYGMGTLGRVGLFMGWGFL